MVPQVELFSFVFLENLRHQRDISKLTDLYMVLSIYSSINLIESIYQLLRSTKDLDYVYLSSKLCQQKVKGYRMTKKV